MKANHTLPIAMLIFAMSISGLAAQDNYDHRSDRVKTERKAPERNAKVSESRSKSFDEKKSAVKAAETRKSDEARKAAETRKAADDRRNDEVRKAESRQAEARREADARQADARKEIETRQANARREAEARQEDARREIEARQADARRVAEGNKSDSRMDYDRNAGQRNNSVNQRENQSNQRYIQNAQRIDQRGGRANQSAERIDQGDLRNRRSQIQRIDARADGRSGNKYYRFPEYDRKNDRRFKHDRERCHTCFGVGYTFSHDRMHRLRCNHCHGRGFEIRFAHNLLEFCPICFTKMFIGGNSHSYRSIPQIARMETNRLDMILNLSDRQERRVYRIYVDYLRHSRVYSDYAIEERDSEILDVLNRRQQLIYLDMLYDTDYRDLCDHCYERRFY